MKSQYTCRCLADWCYFFAE